MEDTIKRLDAICEAAIKKEDFRLAYEVAVTAYQITNKIGMYAVQQ